MICSSPRVFALTGPTTFAIIEYGWKRLADDAATAGVDGFLVPDCPPEEVDGVAAALADRGRAFVPLVTPTTTELDEVVDGFDASTPHQ